MFRHYLLTVIRHLWKRKLYSFISLISLTLGLSIFCLTILHVRHELSYNQGWPEADRIYRMTSKRGGTNAEQPRSTSFGAEFIINITDYLQGLVSAYVEITVVSTGIEDEEQPSNVRMAVADRSLLEVFQVRVVAGNLDNVMGGSGSIALERGQAESLFGSSEAALGERITLEGQRVFSTAPSFIAPESTEFQIAAVYELSEPITNSIRFLAIAPDNDYTRRLLPSINGNRLANMNVWVKLADGVDAERVNEQLDLYLDEYLVHTRENIDLRGERYSDLFDFRLQALTDIYFGDVPETPSGNRVRLLTFTLIALLVLLAGCSNVVSLGLAAAMERRREIGIRKSVGALQQSILVQYLGESIGLSLLALIPVIALVTLLHAPFANLLSITAMPTPGAAEYLLMLLIALSVGLANGLYPAFVLSRVKPVAVLKAQAAQPRIRKLNLRSLLVGLQFSFSVMLLAVTSGLYIQLWVTRNQPLGFNAENLALTPLDIQALQARGDLGDVLRNELERVPGIIGVSNVLTPPVMGVGNAPPPHEFVRTRQEDSGVKVRRVAFKPGLFELLEIPLLAGRDLDADRDQADGQTRPGEEPPLQHVVINRTALNALNFDRPEQALGERLFTVFDYGSGATHFPIEIVGVVEDAMIHDIRQRPGAELYSLASFSPTVIFRYEEAAEAEINQRVRDVMLEVTGSPRNAIFLEEILNQQFAQERRESRLLLMCAALALGLSCIGLYGLVSVALRTQVKEIGVRKVLGSSTTGVVRTFLTRFSVPVMLANLVAWPLAVYFVLQWIQRFPYQLDKGWLLPICLGTTAIVLLIAWFTVGALTWRAASTPPVNSLRYE